MLSQLLCSLTLGPGPLLLRYLEGSREGSPGFLAVVSLSVLIIYKW